MGVESGRTGASSRDGGRSGAAVSYGRTSVPTQTIHGEAGPLLATGSAVGRRAAIGIGRFISSPDELTALRSGEILMADFTLPEWEPAMARAAAIITNRGGRSSHAANFARRIGVPAIVASVDGASRLWTGAALTVSCDADGVGRVYEGVLPIEAPPAQDAAAAAPSAG